MSHHLLHILSNTVQKQRCSALKLLFGFFVIRFGKFSTKSFRTLYEEMVKCFYLSETFVKQYEQTIENSTLTTSVSVSKHRIIEQRIMFKGLFCKETERFIPIFKKIFKSNLENKNFVFLRVMDYGFPL